MPLLYSPCQYGLQVKPGAPATFNFDEATVLEYLTLAPLPGFNQYAHIILQNLNLPSDPQVTADFVEHPGIGEMPRPEDWVSILFPPTGFIQGSYERIGSWLRAYYLAQYAECAPAPPGTPSTEDLVCVLGLGRPDVGDLADLCSPEPVYDHYRLHVPTGNPIPSDPTTFRFTVSEALLTPGDTYNASNYVTHTGSDIPLSASGDMVLPGLSQFDFAQHIGGWFIDKGLTPDPSMSVEVYGVRVPSTNPTPLPPPPGAPEPPPTGTDCADCTQAVVDLSAKVNYLISLVTYLTAQIVPPDVEADVTPTPIPPTGGRVTKPRNATGFIVELVTVPTWTSRYGSDPTFYPDLGHVALLTDDGALPSQLLKHNPMVILNVPYPVAEVGFDLAAGVAGQVRWLRPKP